MINKRRITLPVVYSRPLDEFQFAVDCSYVVYSLPFATKAVF